MNKRIRLALFLGFTTCFPFHFFGQETNENKPNIVYILADDLGIGDISKLNPDGTIDTPNIDALIENGMRFTDAHATASVCTPSRYSIITGEYSWRTQLKRRVLDGYSKAMVKSDKDTAPKLLQRNGYTTAMIGKWHLGWNWTLNSTETLEMDAGMPYKYKKDISQFVDYSKPFTGGPTDCGFDYFFGINASLDFPPYGYSENNKLITVPNETMASMGKRDDFPGGKKNDLQGGQLMMRQGDKAKDFDATQVMHDLTMRTVDYIDNYKSEKPFFLYVSFTAPHTPVLPRDAFKGTSKAGIYGDFIHEMDWTVGQIVSALKGKGIEENTMIIFTADNGASKVSFPISFEEKFNHKPSKHLRGRKGSLHQGGHTVPFIVQWKGVVQPNSINTNTVSQADLYATVADLLNVASHPNQGVDSYSMLSLLKGGSEYERKISVYNNFGGSLAIRKGDWKMDMNPKAGKGNLFNIKYNPSEKEKENFYHDKAYSEIKNELLNDLNTVILNGRSTPGKPLKNEGPRIWKELFWLK